MKRWNVVLLLAVLLSAMPWLRAETAKQEPKTREEQITYFEDTLAEALTARDWKMLQLAVEGFQALKLAGKDMEISILRAERNATWNGGFLQWNTGQATCWGLAVRARLGDQYALQTLRDLTTKEVVKVQPPDPKLYQANPAEYLTSQKSFQAFTLACQKKDHALIVLALAKEPGIQKQAFQRLRAWKDLSSPMHYVSYGGTDPVVVAALLAEPEAGLKDMLALLEESEEKVTLEAKIHCLGALMTLCMMQNRKYPGQEFTLDAEVAALLPKDASLLFVKPYTAAVKNWKPEAGQLSLSTLITIANALPPLPENAETLNELESLKHRIQNDNGMGQWQKQTIDHVLASRRKNGAAAKPPKPPAEGDF